VPGVSKAKSLARILGTRALPLPVMRLAERNCRRLKIYSPKASWLKQQQFFARLFKMIAATQMHISCLGLLWRCRLFVFICPL